MKLYTLIENTTTDASLACEHGLSLYVEACGKRIIALKKSCYRAKIKRVFCVFGRVDVPHTKHRDLHQKYTGFPVLEDS